MKLLIATTDYNETIKIALDLKGECTDEIIFHCYWNGILNEKHLYSIQSCYHFNKKHKIILWLENNFPNEYNTIIKKYAEIRQFSLNDEVKNTEFIRCITYSNELTFYSDLARCLLLYNYGGVWFDLDCLFLRSFDPLLCNFKNDICVYQWENQNYPNNAIFFSQHRKSAKMKKVIEFIMNRNYGWGFQQSMLTYDLPVDLLVLPCSWFDAGWICQPNFSDFFVNTDNQYSFENFFPGSFCYHWHNKWNDKIEDNSIINQLIKIIHENLNFKPFYLTK